MKPQERVSPQALQIQAHFLTKQIKQNGDILEIGGKMKARFSSEALRGKSQTMKTGG